MKTSRRVCLLLGSLALLAACTGCATTTCYILDPRGVEGCRVERARMFVGYEDNGDRSLENVRFEGPGAVILADSMRIEGTVRGGAKMWASLAAVQDATLSLTNRESSRLIRVNAIQLPNRPGWSPPGRVVRIVKSDGTDLGVSQARIDIANRVVIIPQSRRRAGTVGGQVDTLAFRDIAWVKMTRYDGTKSGVLYGIIGSGIAIIAIGMATYQAPSFSP